jgi:hypothetical protein
MSVISFSCESVNPNFSPVPEVSPSSVLSDSSVPEVGAESLDAPIFHEILKHTNSVVSTPMLSSMTVFLV